MIKLQQHALDAKRVLVDIFQHQNTVLNGGHPRRPHQRNEHRQISAPQRAFGSAIRAMTLPVEGKFGIA